MSAGTPDDYFAFMGIDHELLIDTRMLEQRYFQLSRDFHPDFHTDASEEARQASLDNSSMLNRAYRTLKDPYERARHLLALESRDVSEAQRRQIPPSLLMEVMEMQETIAEARHGGRDADPERAEALRGIHERLQTRLNNLRGDLDLLAHEWNAVAQERERAHKEPILNRLNELLDTRNYLRTMLQTVEAALHGAPAPRH
ncbi:MAG TPA: Fe-S protein assembly co-chaperone HscB [Candidatus Kapabacteria bacterium]|nr:Fe-S protein assembly co-chaperone HscB [Candidatus Kapabacteria bacterium]